jgi:hypothetical protein
MSRYKVMVDDNFHYMEEEERWEYGTFATTEQAIAACRKVVDGSLVAEYRPGITADRLYDRYTSFGDEPFVVAPSGAVTVAFSARDYARSRAESLCDTGLVARLRRCLVRARTRRAPGPRP